jgi:hypothetical protein
LLRRGFALEYATLGWNVAGIVVLAIAAVSARSVALAGFGLDSLIEIGASIVVVWELSGSGEDRQRRGLRLIGYAFAALAVYLLVQSTVVLATGYHPRHSVPGIIWTAVTAVVMFALAGPRPRASAPPRKTSSATPPTASASCARTWSASPSCSAAATANRSSAHNGLLASRACCHGVPGWRHARGSHP